MGTGASTLSADDLWATFQARAEAVGATVHHVATAVEAVDQAGPDLGLTARACSRYPSLQGRGRAAHESDRSAITQAFTAALFAVAETGSLVVADANRDRGACLLADHLWVLVPRADIVPTLEGALARIGGLVREGVAYTTIMTGPSRTADIERVLTIGVHGPRELTVLVCEEAAA